MVTFTLNGKTVTSHSPCNTTLLEVLRKEFYLTGVKKGCETGECGACTVLFDGKNVNSCMMLIGEAEGHDVITIEGLAKSGELSAVQRAFAEVGAIQCGYCTPGFVVSIAAEYYRADRVVDARGGPDGARSRSEDPYDAASRDAECRASPR